MSDSLIKRIFALTIDMAMIILYAGLLFCVSLLMQSVTTISFTEMSPVKAQLIGLITLTIPVFLYFFLNEKGKHRATIGKRVQKIQVSSADQTPVNVQQIFLRNFLKLIPWEIAHTGVHWLFYYNNQEMDTPLWVFILLTLPQLIMLIYFISILVTKGRSSIYDAISKTIVIASARG